VKNHIETLFVIRSVIFFIIDTSLQSYPIESLYNEKVTFLMVRILWKPLYPGAVHGWPHYIWS